MGSGTQEANRKIEKHVQEKQRKESIEESKKANQEQQENKTLPFGYRGLEEFKKKHNKTLEKQAKQSNKTKQASTNSTRGNAKNRNSSGSISAAVSSLYKKILKAITGRSK